MSLQKLTDRTLKNQISEAVPGTKQFVSQLIQDEGEPLPSRPRKADGKVESKVQSPGHS